MSVPDRSRVELSQFLDVTPLDDALAQIFQELKLDRPGGPSGRGWSSRSVFMQCPYRYFRTYVRPRKAARSPALETGSLWHQLLAFHYLAQMDNPFPLSHEELRGRLLALGCSAEVVMEAYRLYEAYANRYENDYLRPLAVEAVARDKLGNTCRYDLLATVVDNDVGVMPGLWIIEHKSAARFDAGTLDGWKSDGEILGQQLLWSASGLGKGYGALQGVLVNLVSKTKVPGFERILIPIQRRQLRQHAKDLRVYGAFENVCRATGTWPRARSACVGRYGKCPLFDHCADGTE